MDYMSKGLLAFDRRMEMLFALTYYRKITRRELSEMFSVSDDVIDRDIVLLNKYIPLVIKRGRYGGIIVSEESYNGIKTYLNKEEEQLLRKYISIAEENEKTIIKRIIHKFALPKSL